MSLAALNADEIVTFRDRNVVVTADAQHTGNGGLPSFELLVTAVVEAQRANGDPVDPAGARRLIRALVALGLLRAA